MAFIDNDSLRIEQGNMRNAAGTELFVDLANTVLHMIVLDVFSVSSRHYLGLGSINSLVNIQADKSDLVFPGGLLLREHFHVVLHGSLARRAPGSPKIEEDNLTFIVLASNVCSHSHFFGAVSVSKGGSILDGGHGIALPVLLSYFNGKFSAVFGLQLCELLVEFLNVSLILFGEPHVSGY